MAAPRASSQQLLSLCGLIYTLKTEVTQTLTSVQIIHRSVPGAQTPLGAAPTVAYITPSPGCLDYPSPSPCTCSSPRVPHLRLLRLQVSPGILSTWPVIAPSHCCLLSQDHWNSFLIALGIPHSPSSHPRSTHSQRKRKRGWVTHEGNRLSRGYRLVHLPGQELFAQLETLFLPFQPQYLSQKSTFEEVFPGPPCEATPGTQPRTVLGSCWHGRKA